MDKLRILHSSIIEQYQFIEFHLEGIYALMCGKSFADGLEDVEKHNLRRLIAEVALLKDKNGSPLFAPSEYAAFNSLCDRRNYWCHDCYTKMLYDRKTNTPLKSNYLQLSQDLQQAQKIKELIHSRFLQLSRENAVIL